MPELIDALPGHLPLDRSTGRFLADTHARLEEECALDAQQPLDHALPQRAPELEDDRVVRGLLGLAGVLSRGEHDAG